MKSKQNLDKPANNVCLMAAALQDHMLREHKIKNPKRIKPPTSIPNFPDENKTSLNCLDQKLPRISLATLMNKATEPSKFNSRAQSQISKDQTNFNKRLTMAQKLNLVPAPKAPLKLGDWEAILSVAKNNNQIYDSCAICLEPFKTEQQVLLNCSHVFHKHCLQTFERLEKCRSCPMCRSKEYQRIDVDEAAIQFINKSALMIQSHFKRYLTEMWFYKYIKLISPLKLGDRMKRRALVYKMKQFSINAYKQMNKSKKNIKNMVNDKALAPALMADKNELMSAYIHKYREIARHQKGKTSQVCWDAVTKKMYKRNEKECSICLLSFAKSSENYLLSCSHTFHTHCLTFFEKYSNQKAVLCPLCRNEYERTTIRLEDRNKLQHQI
jgi:hypothetical protein